MGSCQDSRREYSSLWKVVINNFLFPVVRKNLMVAKRKVRALSYMENDMLASSGFPNNYEGRFMLQII